MRVKRDLLMNYLREATDMKRGEILFIPVESKDQQKYLLSEINKEIRALQEIDLQAAMQLISEGIFKDMRLWVCIKKVSASPTTAFIKKESGEIKRLNIDLSSEKERRRKLMFEDGLTNEEIAEIEGGE